MTSASEVVPETVTLTQIEPGVGRYIGTMPTTPSAPVNGDGQLSVSHGDILTVNYLDADDGAGATDVTVKDNADVDCQPPVITNVRSSDVTGSRALVEWDTDENADSLVRYGTSPPGSSTTADGDLVMAHAVRLIGLDECTVHYYEVESADVVGNSASDDNMGSSYTFETGKDVSPQFDSTDTPVAIPDNDAGGATSTVNVTNSNTVVDVDVRVNITHTFDGDITLSLIPPTGAPIVLSDRNGGSGENYADTLFDDEAATAIGSGSPPFAGSFQPDEPLSAADGIDAQGDWQLRVVDQAGADVGNIESWTLILSFPPQACGPNALYLSHDLESDSCAAGGPGNGNGYWENGEEVQFSVAVRNNGTDDLTNVTARVVPLTPGVVMLDDTASFGALAEGTSGSSQAPHFTARLPQGLACGGELLFDLEIDSDQGGWLDGLSETVGEVVLGGGIVLTEDFEGGIPGSWTIEDGSSDGFTWYADDVSDPAGCGNTDPNPPLAGTWAAVDSDCTGTGVAMDESLISPVMDLSFALTASLDFDHFYQQYGPEFCDVDVRSSLTGGAWVNVAQWTGTDTPNPDHATLDITAQAAGASDAQVRWRYYNADFEWFWYLDNVIVAYTAPGSCNQDDCPGGPVGPPPIPDGSGLTRPLLADRLMTDGSEILVSWDDRCSPTASKILYGPLDQVSSATVSGASCATTTPASWQSVPAGNLWFIVVSEDGVGTEGSWGSGSSGERNGAAASNTCGSTLKDLSGSCP